MAIRSDLALIDPKSTEPMGLPDFPSGPRPLIEDPLYICSRGRFLHTMVTNEFGHNPPTTMPDRKDCHDAISIELNADLRGICPRNDLNIRNEPILIASHSRKGKTQTMTSHRVSAVAANQPISLELLDRVAGLNRACHASVRCCEVRKTATPLNFYPVHLERFDEQSLGV